MRWLDDDEHTSIAGELFANMPEDLEPGQVCDRAAPLAIGHKVEHLEGIAYSTFTYKDGSKLTVGDNGFLGSEEPL